MKTINTFLTAIAVSLGCVSVQAAAPANYYSKCENKGGKDLLTALKDVVGNHTVVSYDGLWDVYKTSDVRPNGTVWDMYSTKEWVVGKEHCGNYKNVGDCINREHSMPKSWFNDASPMYSDAFHLYPTDGKVNGQRSNYPYGECARGTTLASNGGVKALGRLGTSTFAGYSGTVFEPDDEYKGDFARSYFYMAAAYNDKIKGWNSEMLAGNDYPAFTTWAVELLLKWHRQDPVSDKELNRNEEVYKYQKNRNPFIDNPEMVEYIWGDKKNQSWTSAAGAQPTLSSPVNNSTLNLGTVAVGVQRSFTVYVKGSAIKNNISVSLTDANGIFSVSPSTLSANNVNLSAGSNLTVTVNAKDERAYTATLSLKSTPDNIDTKVTLTVNAMRGLPATEPTMITDESFMAHWTYVGDEDKYGCYTLYVLDSDGNNVDTYPRAVNAKDEEYLVDELEAETDYKFYITNGTLTSNVMDVRTAAPIPSVQILYDGDLNLVGEPGVPSDPEELLLDIENIYTDVVFTVNEPFQLSSDKSNWNTSLTVDPREDRIYIRIYGEDSGAFSSTIRATAGEYVNDNAEVTGSIYAATSFYEDFEVETQTGNYTTTKFVGNACEWKLSDAGTFKVKNEAANGDGYLRMGKTSKSWAEMAVDMERGMGKVTLMAAGWSSSDGPTKFKLQYSTDQGATWNDAGEAEIAAPTSSAKQYSQFTFTVNQQGKVRMRIQQTEGARFCIDDIEATNYTTDVNDTVFGDERGFGWDAYCLAGNLVVTLGQKASVAIHGVDGITYLNQDLEVGDHTISLPKGLYIVVVGLSTRRVLVK